MKKWIMLLPLTCLKTYFKSFKKIELVCVTLLGFKILPQATLKKCNENFDRLDFLQAMTSWAHCASCLCSLLWCNYCTFLSTHVQNTMFLREEEGRARSAGMKNPLIYRAARGPSQWSNTIVCSSSATLFKNEPTYVIFLFFQHFLTLQAAADSLIYCCV